MSKTSITDTKAREFLRDAPLRSTLACDRIKGFHLIKLSKGCSWRFRYRDLEGRRRTVTIGSYPAFKPAVAAQIALDHLASGRDVLNERKEKRAHAAEQAKLAEQRRFRTYLYGDYSDYQLARKKSGAATIGNLASAFKAWLDRDLSTLTSGDVKSWQRSQEARGLKHSTIKRQYGALQTMLNYAARSETHSKIKILEENPLKGVRLEAPLVSEQDDSERLNKEKERRMLTEQELKQLFAGLEAFAELKRQQRRNSIKHGKNHLPCLDAVPYPHWFIPFCLLGLHTGLRTGDMFSLTWSELNINFGRLDKMPEKTRHNQNPAVINMQLSEELKGIMRKWWEQNGKPVSGYVFASDRTGGRFDKSAHNKPWRDVKKLGGLDDGLVFYSLRHNFISTLLVQGVPLLAVARLAGHKNTRMIEEHYGHLCPVQGADALQVLSSSLERPRAALDKEVV